MKNIIGLITVTLLIAIAGTSCQKDMSLTPAFFRPVTFTTEAQLDAQVASVYTILETDQLYAQGIWGYMDSGADELFRTGVTTTTTNQAALYNLSSSDTPYSNLWKMLYQGIERANVILYVIDRPEMDEAKRKRYKGEVMFLRSFYYYLLVTHYGDVPLKTEISDNMGTDFNLPRNSVKDVYAYLLKDMMTADTLVQSMTKAQTPTIVTQSAVQAMIARVCLSMAGSPLNDASKYKDALTWAQKVINSNIHSLNTATFPGSPVASTYVTPAYSRLFINNMQNNSNGDKNITEGIWDAAFLSKSNTSGAYNATGYSVTQQLGALMGVTCPDATTTSVVGYSGGGYRVLPKLFRLYKPGDLRRDWVAAPYIYKGATGSVRTDILKVNIAGTGGATAFANTSATGVITSVTVENGGSGYTTPPVVTFSSSTGTLATATAVVAGGAVTAINVTAGGSAYPTIYDRPVAKWRREYELNVPPVRQQNYTSCNFPIIRFADVLLMAAEADLKVNGTPSPQAVEYFNQVRRRAYGYSSVTTPVAGFDVSSFTFQDIVDERSRELCFEGLRRQDLLRWGIMTQEMQKVISDNATNSPATYLTAASLSAVNFVANPSKYSLFPIPATELVYDYNLVQNPNW